MNDVNKTLVTEARLADHLKLTGGRIRSTALTWKRAKRCILCSSRENAPTADA